MAKNKPIVPIPDRQTSVDAFFETIMDNLRIDHLMISHDVASNEKKAFYNDMIFGDESTVVGKMRETSSIFFIGNLVKDFIEELRTYSKIPNKLAMGMSDSKILVWAEVNDGDESTEDAVLLSEAKVNAKYHQYGFFINSTIIEKSDNLDIPPHYTKIIG